MYSISWKHYSLSANSFSVQRTVYSEGHLYGLTEKCVYSHFSLKYAVDKANALETFFFFFFKQIQPQSQLLH